MDQIASLEQQANTSVPLINSQKPISDYFKLAAGYLRMAGQCKKGGDYKAAYLNLRKYIILVTERLPQHPQIHEPRVRDEFNFNQQKVSTMQKEVNNLKKQILGQSASSQQQRPKNLPPPPVLNRKQQPSTSSDQPSAAAAAAKDSSSSSSWSFSSFFSGKKKTPPPPPAKSGPPPVPKKSSQATRAVATRGSSQVARPDDLSDLTRDERLAYKAMGTIANNDRVQSEVGNAVARMALNDQVQGKVADGVRNMAMNEKYQSGLGNAIAENTDNEMLRRMARNKNVQKAVGTSLAKTVGNRDLQRKAGAAVATAATNKQVQQAAAKGFMGAMRVGIKGAKLSGKTALSAGRLYLENKRNSQNGEDAAE